MKSSINLFLSMILVLSIMLVACGNEGEPSSADQKRDSSVSVEEVSETVGESQGDASLTEESSVAEESQELSDQEFGADVIIIGAGGAGMTAAIEAHDAGATVIVLEKMPSIGGNTVRSEGGMNAAQTQAQEAAGIDDTVQTMIEDTIEGGKNINNPDLVKFFAQNSAPAIDWLTSIGMDVTEVAQGAGATYPRMHRSQGGAKIGSVLVPVLESNLQERNIDVLLNTKATKLIKEDGKIVGVEAVNDSGDTLTFKANAVVIATGGFGANEDLFVKYRPDLEGFKTTNHPGATGDGIVMAEEVGADVIDMDQIQTNPTVEVTSTTVISESVRGKGAILVNQEGERFISEMETRDVLSAAILEETDKVAYLVFDEKVFSSMKVLQENFDKGIISKANTLEELAGLIGVDADTLIATVDKWNEAVVAKSDLDFNRETGMDAELSTSPYYAIKVSPAVHYTMGGLRFNENTQVINTEGEPIVGLFAAGEVTGGLHGGNRLGGNAVADIIIFGREAGQQSAAYAGTLEPITLSLPEAKAIEPAVPQVQGDYKDGVYKGTGEGNNGPIEVEVEVKDKSIIRISVVDHEETEAIFAPVETDFVNRIIETQKLDVDTIAGATNSSNGIIEAVKDALD